MWIRSQDRKSLIYADRICIKSVYSYEIYQQDENGTITLGIYSNEQKALKVMDMIEDRIRLSEMFKLHIYEPLNRTDQFVFQLPKDDEVEI